MRNNSFRERDMKIFRFICNGINFAKSIADYGNYSAVETENTLNYLMKNSLIEKCENFGLLYGQKTVPYTPSTKFHTSLIYEQPNYFSVISISTNGKAIDRFDYKLNYEGKSKQEIFDNYVLKRIYKTQDFEKYCANIYLIGNESSDLTINEKITRITKEELIAYAHSENGKQIMLDFNGKYVLSIDNKLIFPDKDKKSILQEHKFSEIYEFQSIDDYSLYNALRLLTIKHIEKYI